MLKVNNTRVRFLDEEEEYRLMAECKEHLPALVVTALHTGFRRNELLSLRPEDVDFARGLVSVRAGYAKNGEGCSVPMSGTLRDILGRLVKEAEEGGSSYLFRNCHGEPYRSCRTAFEYAAEQARVKDFRFHDLRHTFASRLVIAGVDIRTVQELMGHKTIAMTLRYSYLSPDHKRRAIDALESRFSEKKSCEFSQHPHFSPSFRNQKSRVSSTTWRDG